MNEEPKQNPNFITTLEFDPSYPWWLQKRDKGCEAGDILEEPYEVVEYRVLGEVLPRCAAIKNKLKRSKPPGK